MTDSLAAAATTGEIEGRTYSADTLTAPARVENQTQIFGKDIAVTETQRAENPAGFTDAYTYQLEKGTKEIMRNIEKTLMDAVTSSTGASGTARVMKTFEDFITTTVKTSTDYTTSATADGQAGIFDDTNLNEVLEEVWDAGGNTDLLVCNGPYKRQISAFTTTNTRNVLATDKKLVIGVDVYDSDFGLVPIQLNRWSPKSTNTTTAVSAATHAIGRIWLLQRSLCRLAWLRPLHHRLMGTLGDSTVGQLTAELCLEVGNEAGLGVMKGVNNKF
jgi:hypothetical protein